MNKALRFTITYDGTSHVLNDDPDGWNDELLNFERSEKYHGIFRSGSMNLRFVGDGAFILRKAYYTDGIAASVTLLIELFDRSSMSYTTLIDGAEFDFLEFNDELNFVECPVIQGGLQRIIDGRISNKYEILLDGSNVLAYDGIKLFADTAVLTYASILNEIFLPTNPEKVVTLTIASQTDNTQDSYDVFDIPTFPTPPLKAFFDCKRKMTVNIEVTMSDFDLTTYIYEDDYNGSPGNPSELDRWHAYIKLIHKTSAGVLIDEYTVKDISGIPTNESGGYYTNTFGGSVNYTNSLEMNDGDLLYLVMGYYATDPSQMVAPSEAKMSYFNASVTTDISTTLPVVDILCIPAKDLMTALLNEMQPSATFESMWMDSLSTIEQPLFVSGDAVRGISSPMIKISMADVFDTLSSIYMLGLGVEDDVLRLEERSYFYKDDSIMNIGDVKDLTVAPIADIFANSMQIGWPTQEYNELNGRDEFNAVQRWKLPIDNVENEVSRIPVVRADMYGIDFLRITYYANSSTDTKDDNEVFIVDGQLLSSTPVKTFQLSRTKFTSITGVDSPANAYNLLYSPKRSLLRWSTFISAGVKTGYIALLSADKNTALASQLVTESGVIAEDTPINTAFLSAPYFLPHLLTFNVPQNAGFFNVLNQYGYNSITFEWSGMSFDGFIKSASIRDARNGILQYTLICSPNTDITQLIR